MKALRVIIYLLILPCVIFLGSGFVGHNNNRITSNSISIEGTYKFISRKMHDGTEVKPPKIMGMLTFTKDYRNFNITEIVSNGKRLFHSTVSKYKLTDKEYISTNLYNAIFDESRVGSKNGGFFFVTNQTDSTPVNIKDGKIILGDPFDNVILTFDKNKMEASAKGNFTDYWDRVK